MNKTKLIFTLIILVILSGCYEERVQEAVSNLKLGMSRDELNLVVKDLKFLMEQTVLMYPNHDENEMRASIHNNKHYNFRNPADLIDRLTFDGDTKVYSYLIRREKVYANPTYVHYVAIFYNHKEDKVIGWAQIEVSGDVDTWDDKF